MTLMHLSVFKVKTIKCCCQKMYYDIHTYINYNQKVYADRSKV